MILCYWTEGCESECQSHCRRFWLRPKVESFHLLRDCQKMVSAFAAQCAWTIGVIEMQRHNFSLQNLNICLLWYVWFTSIRQYALPVINNIFFGPSRWICFHRQARCRFDKCRWRRKEKEKKAVTYMKTTFLSFVTCVWNWELLVFYPWHQRHIGNVNLKHEKECKTQERALEKSMTVYKISIKSVVLSGTKLL